MAVSSLYPLLLERQHIYRLWGGQRIAEWLNLSQQPAPSSIGETWEVYDTNLVRNGALAGQTLAQVTQSRGEQLIGTRPFHRCGADFPLLIKFIDANDKLSLQVHPDDAYAHTYEAASGFHGKTEAWYILEATPHATIIHGLKEPVSREHFAKAVAAGALEQHVHHVAVRAGDTIFTPPGTLHAINAGLLLFEIQQKSDLTYRVYDYGRRDPATGQQRDLHLDKAMEVLRFAPTEHPRAEPLALEPGQSRTLLVACRHFALELLALVEEYPRATTPESLEILTVVEGKAGLTWAGGELTLASGDSAVLPASLGHFNLFPIASPCRTLRTYVPDLERDIAAPLRARGVSDRQMTRVLFEV